MANLLYVVDRNANIERQSKCCLRNALTQTTQNVQPRKNRFFQSAQKSK
jgi:hypothetical protein